MTPMDYRKFLGRQEIAVLPYLGGARVSGPDRELTLPQRPPSPGWYAFTLRGRQVTSFAPSPAPDLSRLPAVKGHWLEGRLVRDGAIAERVELMPEEEPPRFAPCSARRWHSDELLFDTLEFEGESEEAVRRALENELPLSDVKGVPASLRAAFAYALLERVSQRLRIPFAPAEVRPGLLEIANGGSAAADRALQRLAEERRVAEREMRELQRRRDERLAGEQLRLERERRTAELREQQAQLRDDAPLRAEAALGGAGARLRDARMLNDERLEVIFTFMNERFISVVDAATLQVIDSGICLGHPPRDALVTLDSLPSVIKEAIETDALVILRHA